jgi:MFS family permease
MSIFPYVYYMVDSFHVTDDDRKIAIYVGVITSSFTFAEFCAGIFWGKMSDRIGRKPVLIMGLIGTAISMIVFGFSPNLATAIVARCVGGLLNGNMGVLQTTIAEIITVKDHQPRAYSIMPFVWCLGSIIGPTLGGALAQPCLNYPRLFLRGSIFDRFPFLLPNLVCVSFLVLGITIGILFLEETHPQKKYRRDPGLELGKWLLGRPSATQDLPSTNEKGSFRALGHYDQYEDPPPAYRSHEGSPRSSSAEDRECHQAEEDVELQQPRRGWRYSKTITKQVVFYIIGYGILA